MNMDNTVLLAAVKFYIDTGLQLITNIYQISKVIIQQSELLPSNCDLTAKDAVSFIHSFCHACMDTRIIDMCRFP